MKVMDDITHVLKGGMVNGPTLYITQKLVSSVDQAGSHVLPAAVPQELRTPVVGLALATLPLLFAPNSRLANKVSEYTMANAVAQTLALAGNGGTGGPGIIDNAVNPLFDRIAALGAPAGGATSGYVKGGTRGYVGGGTKGYVGGGATAGLRKPMRGLTTEHV